jgi:hypothetical protein
VIRRQHDDLGARRPQQGHALAGHQRVRVKQGHDHPRQAMGHEGLGAGRRAAMVRAGLQRDKSGAATHVQAPGLGIAQGHHLGVRPACLLGVALPCHQAVGTQQHATHAGIGVGQAERLSRQAHGLAHCFVVTHHLLVFLLRARASGFARPGTRPTPLNRVRHHATC